MKKFNKKEYQKEYQKEYYNKMKEQKKKRSKAIYRAKKIKDSIEKNNDIELSKEEYQELIDSIYNDL